MTYCGAVDSAINSYACTSFSPKLPLLSEELASVIADITLNIQNYAKATATIKAFQNSAEDIYCNEKILLQQHPDQACVSFMQVKWG